MNKYRNLGGNREDKIHNAFSIIEEYLEKIISELKIRNVEIDRKPKKFQSRYRRRVEYLKRKVGLKKDAEKKEDSGDEKNMHNILLALHSHISSLEGLFRYIQDLETRKQIETEE